ncbi:MAG TPA: ABC transporter ATP-binding protein [Candidatus Deferrimicrobiaceae bacterium]|nr:ABC transporter ATP-binding protein [Candidatus Deferrimicrobiaceae bacterium]
MLLDMRNVTMSFGGVTALRDVSFSVRAGEILGLIGPNGAGKTTLFHVVTAMVPGASGEIVFGGERIGGLATHRITRRGVGRTFQNIRLFPEMTARENVMVGRHTRSRAGVWRSVFRTPGQREEEELVRRKTDELLALVGLRGQEDVVASALPYGYQRRLEIARALAGEPKLLLLDEPVAGMNENETQEIHRLIRKIRDLGVTVILIEHDMSLVMQVCDRLVVLHFGEKIAEGTPEEIRNNPDVIAAYLGREEEDDA